MIVGSQRMAESVCLHEPGFCMRLVAMTWCKAVAIAWYNAAMHVHALPAQSHSGEPCLASGWLWILAVPIVP
jgi:hypothetical protein